MRKINEEEKRTFSDLARELGISDPDAQEILTVLEQPLSDTEVVEAIEKLAGEGNTKKIMDFFKVHEEDEDSSESRLPRRMPVLNELNQNDDLQ
jgi:hypothetical protein